jgi:hypothetical protein
MPNAKMDMKNTRMDMRSDKKDMPRTRAQDVECQVRDKVCCDGYVECQRR